MYLTILLTTVSVVNVFYPQSAASQCTSKQCHDNNVNAEDTDLSSMVSRLQQQLIDQQITIESLQIQQAKFEEVLNTPEDCVDLLLRGNTESGVYDVYIRNSQRYIQVYCDMTTDGGGWLVVQRRQDGSVDFYRDWSYYKEGFGDVAGEFWLGNDNLHSITSNKRYQLRFDIEDFNNVTRYATYTYFTVASECDKYRIAFGSYSGNAGDSMAVHAGQQFSTRDRDNDEASDYSCAVTFMGAWWYNKCFDVNINGLYIGNNPDSKSQGVAWEKWRLHYSFRRVDMKLRPSDYCPGG